MWYFDIENGKPKTDTITVSRDEALKIGAIIYDKATYKKICDHEYKQNIGLANENDVVLSGFPVSGGGYAQDPTQENADLPLAPNHTTRTVQW